MVAGSVGGWLGVVSAAGIALGWPAGRGGEQADAVARGQGEAGLGRA
jgi:hypothetical protein